jgi:asparagine synthase (glutamine-hydrolysing)
LSLAAEDPSTDEFPLAARAAEHLGADLVKVEATEAKLVDMIEESTWHSEHLTTTFHGAGKLLLSKAVHSAGYKVTHFEFLFWRKPMPLL